MVILTSVSSWLRGQLNIPENNEYIAYCEASALAFAHTFGFCSATAVHRPPPAHTRHTRCHAPWAWDCTLEVFDPQPPRPTRIFSKSESTHRDRSKKYICSYLGIAPRPTSCRITEKSSNITKIATFSIFF